MSSNSNVSKESVITVPVKSVWCSDPVRTRSLEKWLYGDTVNSHTFGPENYAEFKFKLRLYYNDHANHAKRYSIDLILMSDTEQTLNLKYETTVNHVESTGKLVQLKYDCDLNIKHSSGKESRFQFYYSDFIYVDSIECEIELSFSNKQEPPLLGLAEDAILS